MLKAFVERENEIFDALNALQRAGLDFVLVGGYAVSSFQHRYSVDADIVLPNTELPKIVEVLERRGFTRHHTKKFGSHGGEFQAWVKGGALPVTVDLLINGLASRQTDAFWPFDYLKKHSRVRVIQGREREASAWVPEKELLIAIKLHAARLTDARDAVALAQNVDADRITAHALRGDASRLRSCVNAVEREIREKQFSNSFRGAFETTSFTEKQIRDVEHVIQKIRAKLRSRAEKNDGEAGPGQHPLAEYNQDPREPARGSSIPRLLSVAPALALLVFAFFSTL